MQREGDVIHVVAEQLEDLSDLLRSVGPRQRPFPVPAMVPRIRMDLSRVR